MVRALLASTISAAGAVVGSAAVLRGGGAMVRAGDSGEEHMRPEVAAELFGEVAKSWVQARVVSSEGVTGGEQSSAQTWAVSACNKVANAVIQGSEGASDRVHEYMAAVCTKEAQIDGNYTNLCLSFASGLQGLLRGDLEFNRDVDTTPFCTSFYNGPVAAIAKKVREAKSERAREVEAEAKRRIEEAEKHRAAEVERLRQMEEEAKAAMANLSASATARAIAHFADGSAMTKTAQAAPTAPRDMDDNAASVVSPPLDVHLDNQAQASASSLTAPSANASSVGSASEVSPPIAEAVHFAHVDNVSAQGELHSSAGAVATTSAITNATAPANATAANKTAAAGSTVAATAVETRSNAATSAAASSEALQPPPAVTA